MMIVMLEKLFTDKDMTRLIEFLIIHEKWEQNLIELSNSLNISQLKLGIYLELLKTYNLIEINENLIKINSSSLLVKELRVLISQINDNYLDRSSKNMK
jgi:DNA-binding transcriptional regulator LsrR (DeoR family)